MTTISVANLSKSYKVHQKEAGVGGSLRSIFKRTYDDVQAVNNISFAIEQGELIGFIGPNGAGKTTTLKLLAGLLYPSQGSISVLGFHPYERQKAFQMQFSLVMGQKNQLWWDLPVQESFLLNKEIYEIPDGRFTEVLHELTTLLDITDLLKVQVRKLSLGQRMKAELVAALLHSPKVLLLDEPTIGLDVVAQKSLREFIKDYNKRYNATIILTSHYMADVKELCERVVIIDHGKIIYDGSLATISNKYAQTKAVRLQFSRPVPKEQLQGFGTVEEYTGHSARVEIARDTVAQTIGEIMQTLPVADLTIEDPPLEDIIRQLFTSTPKG